MKGRVTHTHRRNKVIQYTNRGKTVTYILHKWSTQIGQGRHKLYAQRRKRDTNRWRRVTYHAHRGKRDTI